MPTVPPSCFACKHLNGSSCDAFPDHIPEEIMQGDCYHIEPYPGDHGIQFEARDGADPTRYRIPGGKP